MKVLYFTRDFNAHDQRFLTALAQTSHQIYLLRLESNPYTSQPRMIPPGVEEITWMGGNKPFHWRDLLAYVKDFKRVLNTIKPDVVHAGPVHTCAYLVALAGFKSLVTMSWASDILHEVKFDPWLARTTSYAMKRTSVLVGDCDAVARKAIEDYHFPSDRIILFPWGVDLELFKPNGVPFLRKELEWTDKFVLLCLRSWEPVYGVKDTIKAFTRAAGEIPDLRLLLYGNGSQDKEIREMITRLGLQERIFLGGKIKNGDLPAVYRSADLYLTAAYSDGSSVSLMEAMACGIPSIVSDIPGNLEWVENGVHGWVFPRGDSDMMAEAILTAFANRKQLKEMSLKSRQKAEIKADWSKNFQRLLYAYELATGGKA
jgi:glycosyltransferase involved in cell wall biosynthesis